MKEYAGRRAGPGTLVVMRSDVASLPGSPERPNEDWVAAVLPASGSGGTVVLLDGVTPPPVMTVVCTPCRGSRRDWAEL